MIGKTIDIEVYKVTYTKDSYGSSTERLDLVTVVKGVVSNPSSRKRAYASNPALLGKLIAYIPAIQLNPSDRLKINGKLYQIAGVTNPNLRNHHLEVVLEDVKLK